MPLLANAPNNLPPAGKVMVLSASSLIEMVMSPELTNLDLAYKMINANATTITVNITIPKIISMRCAPYS